MVLSSLEAQDGPHHKNSTRRRVRARIAIAAAGLCAVAGAGIGAAHIMAPTGATVETATAPALWVQSWATEVSRIRPNTELDPVVIAKVRRPRLKVQQLALFHPTPTQAPAPALVPVTVPAPAVVAVAPTSDTEGQRLRNFHLAAAMRLRSAWINESASTPTTVVASNVTPSVARVVTTQAHEYSPRVVKRPRRVVKPAEPVEHVEHAEPRRVARAPGPPAEPTVTIQPVAVAPPQPVIPKPTAAMDWDQVREHLAQLHPATNPDSKIPGEPLFKSPLLLAASEPDPMTTQDVTTHGIVISAAPLGPMPAPQVQVIAPRPVVVRQVRASPPSTPVVKPEPVVTQTPEPAPFTLLYREALSDQHEVAGASSQPLSSEGEEADAPVVRGWRIAEAPSHWPSLVWVNESEPFGAVVPLLGLNDAAVLAKLAGVTQQEQAALVHGRVPIGYEVALSGRAEAPVYVTHPDGKSRFFVFFNVAPGAQSVALLKSAPQGSSAAAEEVSGVGVPTIGGIATALDLTTVIKTDLRGHVLDAGSRKVKTLGNVTIQFLALPNATTRTADDGSFVLPEVQLIAGYPIYVDTNRDNDFTYRARWLPSKGAPLFIYRYSPEQIQTWIAMLKGGLDRESGMIVSAVPKLAKRSAHPIPFFPSFRTLALNPTKPAEAYTLDQEGQLEVQKPLDSRRRVRTLTVQVPPGPGLVVLEDASGKPQWSELGVSSPGVIQMIGPY